MRQLKINATYRDLLRPLNQKELKKLEASILADGILTKLIAKKGTDEIVDGHHRYSIALKYGIPFEVEDREFATDDDVIDYIKRTQQARRNLSDDEFKALTEKILKLRNQGKPGKPEDPMTLRDISKKTGAPIATISRIIGDAEAMNALAPSVARDVESAPGASRPMVRKLAELSPNDQVEVMNRLRKEPEKYPTLGAAIAAQSQEEVVFDAAEWNDKLDALLSVLRTNFKEMPVCILTERVLTDNYRNTLKSFTASLEDMRAQVCPRCNAQGASCSLCANLHYVSKHKASQFGG
jgi:hypothetical protein